MKTKKLMKIAIMFLLSGNAMLSNAQVTIGSAQVPHHSALLDLTQGAVTNKGFLGPRVALESITDQATIFEPATGLLVFNTGTAGLQYAGYVFWNGQEWQSFTSGSLALGTIGHINCNSAELIPSTYEAGTPYVGTLIVPYVGGNAGTYPEQTVGPVNGLTATLVAGNFNAGPGNLAFTVTGTPTLTSPEVTTFPITIGGQTCSATVGAGDGIAAGELVFYVTPDVPANIGTGGTNGDVPDSWLSYYVNDLPVIGGKLRLDFYFSSSSAVGPNNVTGNPRLVNITNSDVKFWFSAMTTVDAYNDANMVLRPGRWVNLDNGIYYTYGSNHRLNAPPASANITGGSNNRTEIVTLDVILDDKWYRCYYFPIVDNMEQTNTANMMRRVYMSIQRLY